MSTFLTFLQFVELIFRLSTQKRTIVEAKKEQ